MNIFFLDHDEQKAAQYHCDKHVIKMILESAQLLSTAHRVLDGSVIEGKTASGRKKKVYKLNDDRDTKLYSATHVNHPSAQWVRLHRNNYNWLYRLMFYLCKEYTLRYGKVHKIERDGLLHNLYVPPHALDKKDASTAITPMPQAMPDDAKCADSVQAYRNYYMLHKRRMENWKVRGTPEWYS
jgi:hypothetical protein